MQMSWLYCSLPKTLNGIFYINLLFVTKVFAVYCDFNTCDEGEYCCGENVCCQNSLDVRYIWALCIVILIIIVFVLFLWEKLRKKTGAPYYQELTKEVPEEDILY